MRPLIDATEMYLRTVYELQEEGIPPIRARLVERLGLSAPAVSETVARLEQDGLLRMGDDRTLELTELGRELARSVMRKHRLAERLLTDVIGLEFEQVHIEACRWEHVISDRVEQRLVELLDAPTNDPHGNPIPGLGPDPRASEVQSLGQAARLGARATVARISEKLQGDVDAMRFLREHELWPGTTVDLGVDGGQVVATLDGNTFKVPGDAADLVYVSREA
jgi:DtxR family transcriptional regulator, Mn-dependent transcriptional regulator